jgi:hypothetical protein
MDGKIKQHLCIQFCVKLCKSSIETLEMLREDLGGQSLRRTAFFEWPSCFMADRVSAQDNERSGRPNTSKTRENFKKIRELAHEDRSRNELADVVGISYEVCQEILQKI